MKAFIKGVSTGSISTLWKIARTREVYLKSSGDERNGSLPKRSSGPEECLFDVWAILFSPVMLRICCTYTQQHTTWWGMLPVVHFRGLMSPPHPSSGWTSSRDSLAPGKDAAVRNLSWCHANDESSRNSTTRALCGAVTRSASHPLPPQLYSLHTPPGSQRPITCWSSSVCRWRDTRIGSWLLGQMKSRFHRI